MARLTVNEILTMIAATVNQEATAPTGTEYSLWLQYLNRGIQEWVEANDWEVTRKKFFPTVTGTSTATVTLPDDFRKIAGSPRLHLLNGIEGGEEIPEIIEEEEGRYTYNDKYFSVTGNLTDGFSLVFNPATLSSGASISITYFSVPTSLTSPAQVPIVPDSQFLIDRTISYIFEARSDPRFQEVETKAREKLLSMVENANLAKYNSYSNPNDVGTPERKMGFRIGRD